MRRLTAFLLSLLLAGITAAGSAAAEEAPWASRAPDSIRIASFNVGLSRRGTGLLSREIAEGSAQARAIARIILHVRPDVLVLQKFDHDPARRALTGFAELLRAGTEGLAGLDYAFLYQGPVNVGLPSGLDLDGDGKRRGARDAFGYGWFPGQAGMVVLSRLAIDYDRIRTFQRFLWADLPGAARPVRPDGEPDQPDRIWRALRLGSVGHWVLPLATPQGETLTLIAAHPTPPVFDGPEDRNGRRNADEIRLIQGLIGDAGWLVDDRGGKGGLSAGAPFVIAADLNADPHDGAARREGIAGLLADPRIQDPGPASGGGAAAGDPGHLGPPGQDTADWPDDPGNLRVDYVLPSSGLTVTGAGVFWPAPDDPLAPLVDPEIGTKHRLVWVDVEVPGQ